MKLSLIFFLALIYLNLFVSRLYSDDRVILSGEEVCHYLNASNITNINGSSMGETHGFCPIEQVSIKTTFLDNMSPFLEEIKNDFKVGLCYGFYIPAVGVLIITPFLLLFSKYIASPYHVNSPTMQSAFSISKEEALRFYRSAIVKRYSKSIIAAAEEEFIYRFIGLTAIESHVKYLLGKLEYDSDEINGKSQFYAITISSIVFGLLHLRNVNPQIAQAFIATVSGFYFGYIYCENGMIAPLTAHIVNNVLLLSIGKVLSWYGIRLLTGGFKQ
ncbi:MULTISPECIES: CPBP family intramembrane glutamic endopeptidase [unclassified Endozoicomonas]|uniref:CPBP family intramembrane glutamic endopeptidase n=1 Tax=unclassified Endozoicomonas TaxID=2644528 RepID=UPI0021485FF4|nr:MULTISPECIES: CPBP family intramembrane glutamic endopeptidase [unclassified Endozoicomonas]